MDTEDRLETLIIKVKLPIEIMIKRNCEKKEGIKKSEKIS